MENLFQVSWSQNDDFGPRHGLFETLQDGGDDGYICTNCNSGEDENLLYPLWCSDGSHIPTALLASQELLFCFKAVIVEQYIGSMTTIMVTIEGGYAGQDSVCFNHAETGKIITEG